MSLRKKISKQLFWYSTRILLVVFSFSLMSCYFYSDTVYQGPYTLPRTEKNKLMPHPNGYQIKVLPDIDIIMTREVAEQHRILSSQKRTFITAFERREPYHEVLRQILADEGVPQTLLSLALIESGFRSDAVSPSGAVGIWQFIRSTAKLYGLEIGFLRDQRKDPVLSTIAAARMLRELYEKFDDWLLAMAAYNAGPARIDRALRDSGARDFWTLSRKGLLPAETRKFVPKILAAALIEREYFSTVG